MRLVWGTLAIMSLCLVACGQDEPKANTDDPQYKLGYQAGEQDGQNEKCGEIENFSSSMADRLREEAICQ